ncbi:MAG: Fpg/Nei family DNA glycosylase [Candidatus Eisenbacteria bacterium]|nr:Fpg/Nei family DNA glycosylase [Candidatus Eisenbacteria bacterium]
MPELPDVEVFRRYLQSTSLKRRIRNVRVSRPGDMLEGVSRRRLVDELTGSRLTTTRRHGKYLFARASSGGWLVLHFGMTGFLDLGKTDELTEHWRLVLEFSRGYRLCYDCRRLLGRVSFTGDPDSFIQDLDLGPDALSDALDRERFEEQVIQRRGMAKPTLMNQSIVAGIGNVYSDEILFHARIHPRKRLRELGNRRRSKLYRETGRVLRKAIECRAQPDEMPRSWLTPCRGRDGTCPACGGRLKRLTVSGRTAYVCPNRQRN